MRKIGFVSSKAGKSVKPFLDEARRLGVGARGLALEKLEVWVEEGRVRFCCGDEDVGKFDVLMVRDIGKCLKEFEVLLEYCVVNKIRVVDKGLVGVKVNSGAKSLTALRLNNNGLPYPKTVFIRNLESVSIDFGWPCVVMPVVGKAGEGVELANNRAEVEKVIRGDGDLWMVQEYVENDGDYRVMVVGGKALGVVRRFNDDPREFRNNVSLGAATKAVELPGDVVDLAVKATDACGWEFSGVDLIKDSKTGKWYVLEVNRAPQFEGFGEATGINVPEVVIKYLLEGR